jgi:4-aminobutyrate aminotransferase-like enzyme
MPEIPPPCEHSSLQNPYRCELCNAVLEERERCAKECELVAQNWSANNDDLKAVALMCAEQIRTGRH